MLICRSELRFCELWNPRLDYVLDGIGNGYPKPFLPFYLVTCPLKHRIEDLIKDLKVVTSDIEMPSAVYRGMYRMWVWMYSMVALTNFAANDRLRYYEQLK